VIAKDRVNRVEGMTLRRAAVVAGLSYLLTPVTYAEFSIYPKLVIPGNIGQTVQNIVIHKRMFVAAILCYLVTFLLDVVTAWALYVLLVPVNRALSLLTAWFRLIYTAMALFGLLNLFFVFRLLDSPDYQTILGSDQLHVQVKLLLDSFRTDWSASLVVFGIHLMLLGWLIFRSGYIPKWIGILLVLDGLYWVIDRLSPYLYPNVHLGFLFVLTFAELILPLWLLIMGWRIKEPVE
jgi:hypothetical protein